MSGWEIAVLVPVCAAFAVALGMIVRSKIKHKGGCGECDGCCAHCAKAKPPQDDIARNHK